mgnify:CR=1 FL=1
MTVLASSHLKTSLLLYRENLNIAIPSTCSINRLLYSYNIVYKKNKKMRNF